MISSGPPPDAESENLAALVKALELRAFGAVAHERADESDAILEEVLSIEDGCLDAADIGVVRNILEIAGTLIPSGRFPRLEQVYAKAIAALAKHRQAVIADTFLPLNNLAALYNQAGAYRQRDEINLLIIAKADTLTEPIDDTTAKVLLSLAQLYKSVGNAKAVAVLLRPVHRYTLSNPISPDTRLNIVQSFGGALATAGRQRETLDVYRESLAAMEGSPGFTDEQRMTLLFLMGGAARSIGENAEAQSLFEKAKDVAERTQPDSQEAGVVYHTLATLYMDRRMQYDEAESLLEHSSAIAARTAGASSAEYAGSLAQRAVLLEIKGEFDGAVAFYREAFRVYDAALAPKPAEYADFLTDAGGLYLRLGRAGDAATVYQRAYQLRQSLPDIDRSMLADTIANLATAYFESDDLPEAITYYRQAVDLRYHQSSNVK
jgi:tetratricopeptide (TPR) repeat protein